MMLVRYLSQHQQELPYVPVYRRLSASAFLTSSRTWQSEHIDTDTDADPYKSLQIHNCSFPQQLRCSARIPSVQASPGASWPSKQCVAATFDSSWLVFSISRFLSLDSKCRMKLRTIQNHTRSVIESLPWILLWNWGVWNVTSLDAQSLQHCALYSLKRNAWKGQRGTLAM
jgi:hypothetical protein